MHGDRIKGLAGILGLLVIVGGVVFLASQDWGDLLNPRAAVETVLSSADSPANPNDRSLQTFTVRPGDSAASISDRMQGAGLIKNSLAFKLMAESKGVAGDLAAGQYELSPGMRPSEILDVITAGRVKTGPLITIPEGWRSEEIAERVVARGVGTVGEFMAVVRDGKVATPLVSKRPAGTSLEGYLFPDSYQVDAKTTAEDLSARMVDEFESKFTADLRQKAEARGMTVFQIVTLASIIEREAVIPAERPMMAGVFYNRLKQDMRLDTDPTVQYAVATVDASSHLKYGWWKTELTQDDLEVDSPYNTYRYPGLPPGPICNPGLASLMAAVDPTPSDYLYFVARQDGSHAFAKTLEEHNANVAKYRKP